MPPTSEEYSIEPCLTSMSLLAIVPLHCAESATYSRTVVDVAPGLLDTIPDSSLPSHTVIFSAQLSVSVDAGVVMRYRY